ncbi:MAG: ATPase [Candidatus Nealsonbacteria bacterium CG07_land_8_20_14_0_80_40_10]|nr:MAG: ATPase [Candidatus Nealsonbacteria bacterium CG07_land_8_20_14_0_80_40_10]
MNYYQRPISEILNELGAGINGLTDEQTFLNLQKFGLNRLKKLKQIPLFFMFINQFKDLMFIILISIGLIALVIGEPRDTLIIFAIVLVNAVIGFIQEYKAEKILAAFKKHLPSFSKVIRNGKLKKVLTFQLVPGDILTLESGDAIGADARLIEAFDLKTNDIALTGESQPQKKKVYQITEERTLSDIDNMVFMGTFVAEGEGKAVVINTGTQTAFGQIAQQSQEIKEQPTPLQRELHHTSKTVAKIAIAVAFIVLFLLYIVGRNFKESMLFAIAAGVAMVPEGLPAAMSIALSLGAQRMIKKNALVKKLLHVESLGSVTTICTDKTGTLTTGKMSVVKTAPALDDEFMTTAILCNDAILGEKPIGEPLEQALLNYAKNQNINCDQVRKENQRFFEIPFSAKRKMMTVACKNGKGIHSYTKGACLEILQNCDLPEKEKAKIILKNDQMAKEGLRVIALAMKKLASAKIDKENLEKDLTFVGLVGLADPPREGVKEAIRICQKAQIKVIMISGDYGLTALALAKQIGLANTETQVVTGQDLHQMDDQGLKELLKKEGIFARTEPGQKMRIVKNLQEMGEVVAVTGDGINDVPALVKADIGVAMGQIGTDVTKEAADMILLDDNFATIINAVREGRRIFANARKFVFYVFSSNSGELFAPLIGVILGLPLPLIAVQILAIDLGTDVLPSLALGVEKEETGIMKQPPYSKTERIMNIKMLSKLLQIGLVMGFLGLTVFLVTLYEGGWHWGQNLSLDSQLYFSATASVYATLVFCQFANVFSSRSETQSIFKIGFFSNRWLLYAELISLGLLYLVIDFKPLQNVFRTSSPTPLGWLLIMASFFVILFLTQWQKKKASIKQNLNSGNSR